MSDLVKRLREREKFAREETTATSLGDALHFEEAADRIETLEAALRSIADGSFPGSIAALDRGGAALASMTQEIARIALAPEQDK